jgi:response regulator RpfG family c-di-GMP phosphodiesterase
MKSTLIISQNENFNSTINTHLAAAFTTKIKIETDLNEALSELKNNYNDYTFVIIDTQMGTKNATEIDRAAYASYNLFIIIVGRYVKLHSRFKHFDDLTQISKLVVYVTSETQEEFDEETINYLPVNFDLIKMLHKNPSDLFVKIGQNKFIKRFHKDELIESEDVQNLELKTDFLWIKKSDQELYATSLYAKLKDRINAAESKQIDEKEKFELQSLNLEYIRSFSRDLGVTAEVIDLSEHYVQRHIKEIGENKHLLEYLKRLSAYPHSLRFKITQFTIAISSNICDFSQMPNLEESIRKLSFAALFHDICVEEDNDLLIRTEGLLKSKKFELKKINQIKFHAKRASEILMKHTSAPYDSLKIVTEHHGSRLGSGFPEVIDQRLSPLSLIFIISEEFAISLLMAQDPEKTIPKAIEAISKKYTNTTSAKYIKALKELSQFSLQLRPGSLF